MDPLSIAASVAGIIAAAASMAKAISPYASSLKTLPPIALRVRSELINTQFLLGALQNLTHHLETSLPSRTSLIDIDHLEWVFTDGVFIFSELESTVLSIEPPGERLGSMSRMTWVRSEATLKGLLERLSLFKDSVLLLLNILQCNSDSEASLNQQALHRKVDTLRTGDEQLARRMINLEDAFDSLKLREKSSTACSLKDTMKLEGAQSSTRPGIQHEADTPGDEDWAALDSTTNEQAISGQPLPSTAQLDDFPVFTFDTVLQDSRAYQRSHVDRSVLLSQASAAQSNYWSIFSGITLSDISVIAAIALPIYSKDISNPQHYDFTRPGGASNLQVNKLKTTNSSRSRHIPFTDIDELWEANNEHTIGDWAKTRAKVFKLRELRYEFTCQAPVIHVNHPDFFGSDPASSFILLTGEPQSYERSLTANNLMRDMSRRSARSLKEKEAWPSYRGEGSWLLLLETIQRMEATSSEFMRKHQFEAQGPRSASKQKEPRNQIQTIAVAIHMETIRWDRVPHGIRTGYGTTTWCDLVQLLAMIGVYWVALDIPGKAYHAEGNGFVVTSQVVSDLGVFFHFQSKGFGHFKERRVIPTERIRNLAFGKVCTTVSTTTSVNAVGSLRRISLLSQFLDFGSKEKTVVSLTQLGCNSRTVHCFSLDNRRQNRLFHLFPILFEVVGMLGLIHHIRDTPFRFLPNPTMFHWNQSTKFMKRLLDSFQIHSGAHKDRHGLSSSHVNKLHTLAWSLTSQDWEKRVPVEKLHDALDSCDWALLRHTPDWPQSKRTTKVAEEGAERVQKNQEMMLSIIRRHLQETLSFFNQTSDMSAADRPSASDQSNSSTTTVADLDEATPEDAPWKLMNIYFNIIRPKVTAGFQAPMEVIEPEAELKAGSNRVELSPDEIWCTLIFRMICWLSLHDFNEADTQRSQSLLHSSKVPVYIS